MNLTLEAIFPAEGLGIVRRDQKLRLVRPPYVMSESSEIPEKALEDAIIKYGFFSSGEQFANWTATIDFLRQQLVDTRHAAGLNIPESMTATDLVEYAPIEVLVDFLNRIEVEIIPQRLFDLADDILVAILANEAIVQDLSVTRRVTKLLQECKRLRRQVDLALTDLSDCDLRFHSLVSHGELQRGNRLAEQVRSRGCVFSLAA